MRLLPDSSCTDKRAYRLELEGIPVEGLSAALADLEVPYTLPGASRFEVEGQTVLLVRATCRVAIRVSVDVPKDERRAAAERVVAAIAKRLASSLEAR